SDRQGSRELVTELLGSGVVRETQDVAVADPGQAAGPRDEQKAQGPDAAKDVDVGALARARLGDRPGRELEVAREIMGQDAELVPRRCWRRSGWSARRRARTPL